MKLFDFFESRDMCNVCGQTPCNCTHLNEGIAEGGENWIKLPNGNYRNMHTGVTASRPPKQKRVRGYKWEVNFDYGPHQSTSVTVTASSENEACAKAEKLAEKNGYRSIMINWAKPADQGVAEGELATYLVSVMDSATGEHWRIEVKVTSPEMAKERAEAMGYKVLGVKEKGVAEMDSQGYTGSRDHKRTSKYGSRDDYELGGPETTLGPDSIAKPKDVAKKGADALNRAMRGAHPDYSKHEKKLISKMSNAEKVNKGWRNPNIDEGSGNIGPAIKSLYKKIYRAGDDEIEYFYNASPIFAQYWDEYEGDLNSIIAEVDPAELQIIHDELASYVDQAGLEEGIGKDMAKLGGIAAAGIGAGLAGNYLDQQQPKVQIGDKQAYYVANPGWGRVPDNAMTLTGKDGKEYVVWAQRGKGSTLWYATPAEKVKEGVAESWDPDTLRLKQEIEYALDDGDDYTAKQYAKMAPTPEAKKYLLNIIKQAMYIDDLGGETDWKGVAEDTITESPAIDLIRSLISEFNTEMSGSPYYPMDYKNPGMRLWTRGDGSRYKDPGYIFIERDLKPEDQPKWHKAKAVEKFWKFLESKGARRIGDVSGEFGSDPHSPAVVLNKLIFVFNGRSIAWGSTSRLKNSSVWRQKQPGVAEGVKEANTSHQHHVVSKLDGNVLASYKTKQEAHKNAHGNPVVSGSLETIGDKQYVREQGVAEGTIHVGYRNSSGDWIKTTTHDNYRDAKAAMERLVKRGKKGVQHRYDNKGNIDPGAMMTARPDSGVAEGLGKDIDYTSLELDGVHAWDRPDYSDAYFSYGEYIDGTPLPDEVLDQLSSDGDLLRKHIENSLYEGPITPVAPVINPAKVQVQPKQNVYTPSAKGGSGGAVNVGKKSPAAIIDIQTPLVHEDNNDLVDFIFAELEQQFPDVVSKFGHEVVGDAIADTAVFYQDAEDDDIRAMVQQVVNTLQHRSGGQPVQESRLYYNTIGTPSAQLRSTFKMRKDRNGWFLKEDAAPKIKLEALRAFGSPALKEYDLSAFTGGTQTQGPDNVVSPVGSVPKTQRKKVKKNG